MDFELTILGSSSAVPTSLRNTTAQVLHVLGRFFLIDCGEGTQLQMRKFKIPYNKINHVFISHVHGDHIFGLIGYISSMALQGRKTTLHIYTHKKLEEIIQIQLELLNTKLPYKIEFHYLDTSRNNIIYEDKRITVTSFSLKHRDVPTCGFLFKEKEKPLNIIKEKIDEYNIPISQRANIKNGLDFTTKDGIIIKNKELTTKPQKPRSYAYCSDTAYTEKFIEIIKEVNLLYHEATHANDNKERAKETYHSTAEQAAIIAQKANVSKLIIGHFSTRYPDTSIHESEARKIFPNTFAVKDGDVFIIE